MQNIKKNQSPDRDCRRMVGKLWVKKYIRPDFAWVLQPTGPQSGTRKVKTTRSFLNSDLEIRDYLKKKLSQASVSRIQIDRPARAAFVVIHTARPGIVIGKKGEDVEALRKEIAQRMDLNINNVKINIEEIRKPEIDAQLVSESVAQQLERRIMFRRAMKRAVSNAIRLGALGVKINVAGRLNGAEIARSEWYREGRVPLHTLRADIDLRFLPKQKRPTALLVLRLGYLKAKYSIWKASKTKKFPMPSERMRKRKTTCYSLRKQNSENSRKVATAAWRKTATRSALVTFGLKAVGRGRLTARQIEAARRAMTRHVKRGGKIWIRIFPRCTGYQESRWKFAREKVKGMLNTGWPKSNPARCCTKWKGSPKN